MAKPSLLRCKRRANSLEAATSEYCSVQACPSSGELSQLRATFKESLTFRQSPDLYMGFKINTDGTYEEVFNGPGEIIAERWRHRSGLGKQLHSFPITQLRKLSKQVEAPKVRLRS